MLLNKIKISYLVIITLIIIIILQRSCKADVTEGTPTTTIVTDTVWKKTHDTVFKDVKVVERIFVKPEGVDYSSGETLDTCKARFQNLLKEHLVRTIYSDTLELDSLGTIVVRDTVWLNKLYGKRSYTKDYKIPYVTKTVTITKEKEPVRQLYIGGNVFGDKNALQLLTPGVLYKTKKDHIYQGNLGINFDGSITYGVGAYWKISFKK
jgi:hypothetical protein